MIRQQLSRTELITQLNNLFASHEQSVGSRVINIEALDTPDSSGCNWRCGEIDHGDNRPFEYQTLRQTLIHQCQSNYNLKH